MRYPPPPQRPSGQHQPRSYPQTAPGSPPPRPAVPSPPHGSPAKKGTHLATIVVVVAGVLAIPFGLWLIGETRIYARGFGGAVLVGVGLAIVGLVLMVRAVAGAGERSGAVGWEPGWYQNPDGPGRRWWDGQRWTDHIEPPR